MFGWTDWDESTPGFNLGPNDESTGWKEFSTPQTGSLLDDDFLPDGSYTSAQSFGQWYGGLSGAALRGGRWVHGVEAGVFTILFGVAQNDSDTFMGFRCVYRP